MKKVIYILLILMVFICSCYTHEIISLKGLTRKERWEKKQRTEMPNVIGYKRKLIILSYPDLLGLKSSYAADRKRVRNVNLIKLGDYVSERCFTSIDIKIIKKFFSADSLLKKKWFEISPVFLEDEDLVNCYGLFKSHVWTSYNEHTSIPIIKLHDTLYMNGVSGIEIDETTKNYLKEKLLEVYDSVETKKRINYFLKGKRSGSYCPRGRVLIW